MDQTTHSPSRQAPTASLFPSGLFRSTPKPVTTKAASHPWPGGAEAGKKGLLPARGEVQVDQGRGQAEAQGPAQGVGVAGEPQLEDELPLPNLPGQGGEVGVPLPGLPVKGGLGIEVGEAVGVPEGVLKEEQHGPLYTSFSTARASFLGSCWASSPASRKSPSSTRTPSTLKGRGS